MRYESRVNWEDSLEVALRCWTRLKQARTVALILQVRASWAYVWIASGACKWGE